MSYWFWICYTCFVTFGIGFLIGRTSNMFMSKKWISCRDQLPWDGKTIMVKEPFEKPREAFRQGEKWIYTSGLTGWVSRGDKWKIISKK